MQARFTIVSGEELESLLPEELADILDATLNRKVDRVSWTVPMLKEQLANEPDSALRKYRVVFAEGEGVAWGTSTTFNAQRAIPVVGVERWVREHLKQYRDPPLRSG